MLPLALESAPSRHVSPVSESPPTCASPASPTPIPVSQASPSASQDSTTPARLAWPAEETRPHATPLHRPAGPATQATRWSLGVACKTSLAPQASISRQPPPPALPANTLPSPVPELRPIPTPAPPASISTEQAASSLAPNVLPDASSARSHR